MPPLPETIVFDLDGTIIDTAPDLAAALNAVLIRERLPPVPLEKVRHMVGRGARALIENAMAWNRIAIDPARMTGFMEHFLDYYAANIAVTSRAFDGMQDTVTTLKGRGHKIGICTNKPGYLSQKLLSELALTELFPVVLGADARPYRKPDPRHLLDTIQELGGNASDAALIGDSDTDLKTARAANVPVILVDFGYTDQPAASLNPDAVISHFDELIPALEQLKILRHLP